MGSVTKSVVLSTKALLVWDTDFGRLTGIRSGNARPRLELPKQSFLERRDDRPRCVRPPLQGSAAGSRRCRPVAVSQHLPEGAVLVGSRLAGQAQGALGDDVVLNFVGTAVDRR